MKHKHCDIIKAWADGASIQHYSKKDGRWIDNARPTWSLDCEWRIKPNEEFLKYKVALFKSDTGRFTLNCYTPDAYNSVEEYSAFITWILDEQTVNVGWLGTENGKV